ncbi:MAG: PKD domain-containing protein, partial [Candidatus Omnitrophota bacterium]
MRIYLKIISALILIQLFCLSSIQAEPQINSVDSSIVHNQIITATGSGFGVKERAAPLFFDDFENGTDGQKIPITSSGWSTNVGGYGVSYSSEREPPGSVGNLVSKHDMSGTYNERTHQASIKYRSTEITDKVFISFWVYFTYGTPDVDGEHQMKLWRIEEESATVGAMKVANYNWLTNFGATTSNYYQWGSGASGGSAGSRSYASLLRPTDGGWYQVKFQGDQSENGVANGSVQVWHSHTDGTGSPIVKVVDLPNLMTRNVPQYWNSINIGEVCTNRDHALPCNAINYFDDFYVDNTWARVELGDASSYSACAKREIQIPQAWSQNSVTFRVNQGTFSDGATAYLYIVDESGAVNAQGYPLTIGTSGPIGNAPVATMGSDGTKGQAPFTVQFMGVGVDAGEDGTSMAMRWDFGDGTTATGWNPKHIYTSAGTYTAKFTVTDKDANSDSKQITITVTQNAPSISYKYVSPTAGGSGNGTQSNPWTASQAFNLASPGDVVLFADGTYPATNVLTNEWQPNIN